MESNDIQHGIAVAWHKLTLVKTAEEIARDGFPYELERKAVMVDGKDTGYRWLAGSDDGKLIAKPFNPETYSVLSNARFLDIVKNALSGTKAAIESIGTFEGRAKRYATVKLGADWEQFAIGKRQFFNRLNLQEGLDGSMTLIAKAANTCIVCANTFAMSLHEKSDFRLSLRHTSGMADKLENFEKAIEAYRGISALYRALFEHAETVKVSEETAKQVFVGFLAKGAETSTRTLNQADRMVELFNTGRGNAGENVLDMISAVTDFYTHESSGKRANAWKQYKSSEIGAASESKAKFVNAIREGETVSTNRIRDLAKLGEQSLALSA